MSDTEQCTLGIENKTKIDQLRTDFDRFNKTITKDIREIKDKLLGRPSWFVCITIVVLAKLCAILGTYIITTKS
jgi:hypothetical protein